MLHLRHGKHLQESAAQDDPSHLVDSVAWSGGNHLRITYADGSSMPVIADRTVALVIALDAGLSAIPAPEGTAQWARVAQEATA